LWRRFKQFQFEQFKLFVKHIQLFVEHIEFFIEYIEFVQLLLQQFEFFVQQQFEFGRFALGLFRPVSLWCRL
jgi:hypothetical protein